MQKLPTTPISGSDVRVIFGAGLLDRIGEIVKAEGLTRALLVSDPGIMAAGHVERAVRSLFHAGIAVRVFDGAGENPTVVHVGKGVIAAKPFHPDLIIGLGGGSSIDCAKGINFILSNGGRMHDYWGTGKATKPMLPLIAIPTTAGTGSDAQSYALITDPDTHQKMACGDKKALPRIALLDPELTRTQPAKVAAATGIDAVAHAVETAATSRRNETSRQLSVRAWKLLDEAFEPALRDPGDVSAREKMLLGAHIAGAAIENSMLGAAHALANPLTALAGLVHGQAVGMMLPMVVRYNSTHGQAPYSDLMADAESLARRIEQLLAAGSLPRTFSQAGVAPSLLPDLAKMAAQQWTAGFNPCKVGESELLSIYQMAAT